MDIYCTVLFLNQLFALLVAAYILPLNMTPLWANCFFVNDTLFTSKRYAGLLGSCVTQVCVITFLKVNLSPGRISEIA
jgi:hypothetical protein